MQSPRTPRSMSPRPGSPASERGLLIDTRAANYRATRVESNNYSVDEEDYFTDHHYAESKSTMYLILLTLSIGGLQIAWSIELSNGSPYLLSLGMSKALMASVWLAGPVTGALVQPYVGMLSDKCRLSIGKRKPFMIAGTLGVVISSFLLAYARQIVQVVGRFSWDEPYEGTWKVATITMATVMMWVLDFSINTVQASIRAFIVDGAPAHQQEAANAWASRIVGVGNVFGYIAGYLDLPHTFSFLGKEQFQVLVAFASIVLSTLVGISVICISERDPSEDPETQEESETGLINFFRHLGGSITRLPPKVSTVCKIQFFNWMGWFPFLFYVTTYIGQLYVDPKLSPDLPWDDVNDLWGKATRVGTFALLIEAIVSLVSNIVLPFLIVPTYKADPEFVPADARAPMTPMTPKTPKEVAVGIRDRKAMMRRTPSTFSAGMGLLSEIGEYAARPPPPLMTRVLEYIRIPGFTLRRAWFLAQLLFSACMFSTFFITTTRAATIMVACVGLSWSLTLWAPFALISGEISKRDEERRFRQRQKLINGDANAFYDEEDHEEDRAGIILGLHNMAVSTPQIIATLVSSLIFKWLQKPRNIPGDVSVAWTLRFGGVAVLIAAFLTFRMEDNKEEDDEID